MNPDFYFGGKMIFLYLFLFLCFVCIFGYFMYDDYNGEWLHFLSKFKFFQTKNTFIIYLFKFWITASVVFGGLFFLGKLLASLLRGLQ